MSLKVTNTNLNGIHLIEIPGFDDEDVVCSRLKRASLLLCQSGYRCSTWGYFTFGRQS